MGSMPPNAGPPPGGDFSQVGQGSQPGQPYGQPNYGRPGPGQQPLPPPAKKGKTWIWVIGGCFGLLLLGAIGLGIAGYFAIQKTKEVVGDFERQPVLTAAKALVMMNPELELVDADEENERITIRERKTGKTVSVTLDELKEGKITFTDAGGEEYKLQAEAGEGGEGGKLTVQSSDGAQVFQTEVSGDSQFPNWVPVPPGKITRTTKTTSNDMIIYGSAIETEMGVQELADWLENEAKSRGFRVAAKSVTTGTEGASLMFSAMNEENTRILSAMGGTKRGANTIEIIFSAQEKP